VQRGLGNEKVEADQVTSTSKVKFKIRFFDGIDESMRISYNSKYYDILDIQELGREGLMISASKKL
jgi:SPP1 family predicted phage head-tail adaptor